MPTRHSLRLAWPRRAWYHGTPTIALRQAAGRDPALDWRPALPSNAPGSGCMTERWTRSRTSINFWFASIT